MTRVNARLLIERAQTLTGLDAISAERAIRVVAGALLSQLSPHDRDLLVHALPRGWAASEPALGPAVVCDEDAFYTYLARQEGVGPGRAKEHTQGVCRALSEALDDDTLRLLVSHLPDAIAQVLVRPEAAAPSPSTPPKAARGQTRTLAGGRPGSSQPLSEARPERAQRDSVASSDNPHGDTKLSTTHGVTQEREAETLAQGGATPRPRGHHSER